MIIDLNMNVISKKNNQNLSKYYIFVFFLLFNYILEFECHFFAFFFRLSIKIDRNSIFFRLFSI